VSAKKYKYIFGPVPSRRLGRSLGVDLVPFKVCSYDCIYCQLGRTTRKTARRDDYVPAEEVISELHEVLSAGVECDYITFSGSGEPTLHRDLGRIIAAVKEMTGIPVAVLTNGSLLSDPEVRRAILPADVILPSLDAGDEQTFARVNRPCPEVSFPSLVEGLKALRREYRGRIDLEVMLVAGINDSDQQLRKLKAILQEIGPDHVDLNTVTRPAAEAEAHPVEPAELERIRALLGPRARIIGGHRARQGRAGPVSREDVLAMLRRRPCTLEDLVQGLQCHRQEAAKLLDQLADEGAVVNRHQHGKLYYQGRVDDAKP
jgi:wyosine [tRNA(Phe)-imidazoG37] synthetase (radical SAM superfamily)